MIGKSFLFLLSFVFATGEPLCNIDGFFQGCEAFYFDLGTNLGVQIAKLYYPEKFPQAKVTPYFQRYFGSGKKVCALGFEPNPMHTNHLMRLQNYLSEGNHTAYICVETGVSNRETVLNFSSYPQHHGGSSFHTHGGEVSRIPVVDAARVLTAVLKQAKDFPSARPVVVVKMDVEGEEYTLVPHLLESSVLCEFSVLLIEWHPHLAPSTSHKGKDSLLLRKQLEQQCPQFRPDVREMDDETYKRFDFVPLFAEKEKREREEKEEKEKEKEKKEEEKEEKKEESSEEEIVVKKFPQIQGQLNALPHSLELDKYAVTKGIVGKCQEDQTVIRPIALFVFHTLASLKFLCPFQVNAMAWALYFSNASLASESFIEVNVDSSQGTFLFDENATEAMLRSKLSLPPNPPKIRISFYRTKSKWASSKNGQLVDHAVRNLEHGLTFYLSRGVGVLLLDGDVLPLAPFSYHTISGPCPVSCLMSGFRNSKVFYCWVGWFLISPTLLNYAKSLSFGPARGCDTGCNANKVISRVGVSWIRRVRVPWNSSFEGNVFDPDIEIVKKMYNWKCYEEQILSARDGMFLHLRNAASVSKHTETMHIRQQIFQKIVFALLEETNNHIKDSVSQLLTQFPGKIDPPYGPCLGKLCCTAGDNPYTPLNYYSDNMSLPNFYNVKLNGCQYCG